MPSQITNYQCPSCNGPLHYGAGTNRLVCDYCGKDYSVGEIEAYYKAKDQQAIEASKVEEEKKTWLLVTNWKGDRYVFAMNGQTGKLIGDLPVDKGKDFLPRAFHDENHIEEIKGLYAPFWLYDGAIEGNLVFHATKVSSYRLGNEEVTTTDHFTINRGGTVSFERVPADASSKLPDPHMDSIEPYDYSELKPFSTGYLPGYMADKYDIDAMSQIERIASRERNTVRNAISNTVVGYSTASIQSERYRVWLLVTNWKGDRYVFAMNGQTGKLIGDLPVDKGKFWLSTLLGANVIALIVFLLSIFL